MKAFLTHYAAYIAVAGLFLIGLLFFYQPLFSGEIINATDILTQQYFWNVFIKDNLLHDPCFRTWLPYINAGTPFSGGLNLIFRPVSLLTLLLLPAHIAINYELISYFLLMGVGMYFFMRELRVTPLSSFLAALFLMLSGQIVTLMNAGHVNKMGAIFPTPLVFLALERALRRKTFGAFLLTAAALGFQFWQGHIQISFYTCIAVGLYFLVRVGQDYHRDRNGRQLVRGTAFALVMVIVFLAFSAVEFLPMLAFARVSERAEGVSYEFAATWSMPPEELITYLIPGFFGFRRLNYMDDEENLVEYWGRMPFTQTGHYAGLLPLLLMLLAIGVVRKRPVLPLAMLAATALYLGMGRYMPTYKWLYDVVPGFDKFRVPQMILFLFAFAGSGLAGFGAEWLLSDFSERKETRLRLFLIAGIALFLGSWVITLSLPALNQGLIQLFEDAFFRKGATPEVVIARFHNIRWGFLIFNGLLGMSLCVLGLRLVRRIRPAWIAAAIILVFIVDIGWFNEKFMDTIPLENSHYVVENDAIRYMKEHPGFYRMLPMTDRPASYNVFNKVVLHKLFSVSGYEAVGVQYYTTYLEVMMNTQEIGSRLMDMLNIKYLILPKGVQFDDNPIEVGDVYGPYKIVLDGDAVLVENLNVLPRVYPVHHALTLNKDEEIFGALLHPEFEPREMVILEDDPGVTLPKQQISSSASQARITHYFNRAIEVEVDMAADAFLVLSEKYYPGWRAYVDEQETDIYKANYTVQAVFVPQGQHRVLFAFQPTDFLTGLGITLLTCLAVAGFWLVRRVAFTSRETSERA